MGLKQEFVHLWLISKTMQTRYHEELNKMRINSHVVNRMPRYLREKEKAFLDTLVNLKRRITITPKPK